MKIPWIWAIMFSIFEVVWGLYKLYKNKDEEAALSFGIIFGIWFLILVSYMNTFTIVKIVNP